MPGEAELNEKTHAKKETTHNTYLKLVFTFGLTLTLIIVDVNGNHVDIAVDVADDQNEVEHVTDSGV
jgi:hypothetical protein